MYFKFAEVKIPA